MPINLAAMQKENERLAETPGGGGGGFLESFVMMPEGNGSINVRILPPDEDKDLDLPYVATRIHTINERKVHCRKEAGNGDRYTGDCPICDYYNLLWKEADAFEKKGRIDDAERKKAEARAIKPVPRYYYNVIVRSEKDKNGKEHKNVGPKILSVGKTLHQRVVRAICGDKGLDEPPLGDVTDLKKGRDFKIIKRMTSGGRDSYPNYDESKFLDVSPAGNPDENEKWMENLHDLNDLRKVKTVAECERELAIHMRLEEDETQGFNRKSFEAKYSGNRSVTSNTGDDDEDETEAPVQNIRERLEAKKEAEAPAPKATKKKAAPAPPPPVEDDDEDETTEEEDQPIDAQKFLEELQNM